MSQTEISEMVWDSESEEDTAASSETTSEEEGGLQDDPGISHQQPDRPTSSGQPSSSSISTSASDGFRGVEVNSGYGPLALREMSFSPSQGAPG